MKTSQLFILILLPILFSCNQTHNNNRAIPDFQLPTAEQGLIDQLHRAANLIPLDASEDRKTFLEDSLKASVDEWLSKTTGLKADRWMGIVVNDTSGQSLGISSKGILQLELPVKINEAASENHIPGESATVTLSIDDDDQKMMDNRMKLKDGDTVVFSGVFKSLTDYVPDMIGISGSFFLNPLLGLMPTEVFKKTSLLPKKRPNPDTAGLAKAPIKVTARLVPKIYERHRFIDIYVSVKNISQKPVKKFSIRRLVINKGGEPAKVNGATGAWQEGYFHQEMQPGETVRESWQHTSPDGVNIKLIYPKWVILYNGLQWVAGK